MSVSIDPFSNREVQTRPKIPRYNTFCMCYDGRHYIDPVDQDLTEYHKQTVDISLSLSLSPPLSLDTPKLQPNYKPKYPPPQPALGVL